MLLLPHGSYLHLSRVFACLAGLACSDYELQMGGLRAFVQGVSAMAASQRCGTRESMDAAAVACEAVLVLCILTRARLYCSPEGSGIVRVSVNVVVTNGAALYSQGNLVQLLASG